MRGLDALRHGDPPGADLASVRGGVREMSDALLTHLEIDADSGRALGR